jgi:uncharacterized RDD family membrane protein YckC
MTDPAGGAPTPPPPEPTPAPPAAAPPSSWQSPPPVSPAQFQQAPVAAGPAPGVAYADLVTRIIAVFIDGIILAIIYWILLFVAAAISIGAGAGLIVTLLFGVIWAGASIVYFVYTWTTMRASPGQKFLNLETVNAADGATLTQNQAIRRWVFLWGPIALGAIVPILGILISLLALIYLIYLIYTINQSPKRQGYHDVQASTVVVKRG